MAAKKKAAKKTGKKAANAAAPMKAMAVSLKVGANGGKLTKARIAAAVNALQASDIQKVEDSKNLFLADGGSKRP
jgi:hypothetical protein